MDPTTNPETPPPIAAPPRAKVLLVEDEQHARDFLAEVLRERGHAVTACPNAESAWEIFQREDHPLVILDWLLPGIDGLELCRMIRATPRGETRVVLMVTARNQPEALQEIIDAGADDYLAKPLDLELFQVRLSVAERVALQRAKQKKAEDEKKEIEAQIRHAQKLESLGVLSGGIAHDFNNLLLSILGYAGLATMELDSDSPALKNIEQIEIAGRRAAELTNQLLAYSGKGQVMVQPLHVSQLVEEMSHLLETVISKSATLRLEFDDDDAIIEGDVSQIRQVIMNLITNASDALDGKTGVITARTKVIEADAEFLAQQYLGDDLAAGRYVLLEISDTGCGISDEALERIFDPFFTTKSTGRGLGLAAVLGIVRGHRGAIRVRSKINQGTLFQVLLPCAETMTPPSDSQSGALKQWRGSGTVLVVDDEKDVREVSKLILEKFGFTVVTAEDGAEGMEVFRKRANDIEVVLLDMTMPQMGGRETLHEIRQIRPDARVILTSGFSEEEIVRQIGKNSRIGFIQKPYGPEELLEAFKKIVESRPPELN